MIQYDKQIRPFRNLKRGYIRFYDPQHPLSDSAGVVYLHRHVASIKLQRWLTERDVVHHINGKKDDNREGNLIVMQSTQHSKIHRREQGQEVFPRECAFCKKTFKPKANKTKYCSVKCFNMSRIKFKISPKKLEELVFQYPTSFIAKQCCVSDTAVAKRCKKLGIKKPPRGYWSKNKSLKQAKVVIC